MPDLGTYAGPVLWSYALSLILLVLLVVLTLAKGRRARQVLAEIERRRGGNG